MCIRDRSCTADGKNIYFCINSLCVCVCVRERERERERALGVVYNTRDVQRITGLNLSFAITETDEVCFQRQAGNVLDIQIQGTSFNLRSI